MEKIILYPCEFGKITKVDREYEVELEIALKNGVKTMLFNYDAYTSMGERLNVHFNFNLNEVDISDIIVIYRGWMLKPEQYSILYTEILAKYNLKLINNPYEYESAHCFNIAYDKLMEYTPKIAVFGPKELIEWSEVRDYFKKFMIKDYVKSVKEWDFPEYFDYTYTDEQLDEYVERFKDIRGDLFTGGIILKEFIELDNTGGITHEFRGFFYRGRLITLYHNSNNKQDKLDKVRKFAIKLPKLNSNFYTIDFAITKNGNIIVLECGDGQVSGLPSNKEVEELYEKLLDTN